MRRSSPWFIAALVLLLVGGGLGLRNGWKEWPGALNGGQSLAALVEMGYGLAGLVAAAALWVGHPRTMAVVVVWAILITATGSLAPVVWGGAPVSSGILSGIASAAISGAIVWLARRALRSTAQPR